jgi:ketosteroid isomerase-like protein
VTDVDHRAVLTRLAEIMGRHDWAALSECVHDDAVFEYPQSGERFVGIDNIRRQFENYPGLEPGSTSLEEVIGGTTYALSPMYTIVEVAGSGNRGTAIMRARYPDGSHWFALNTYELRGDRIARSRTFFAPEFDAPDWRAPYREPIQTTSSG